MRIGIRLSDDSFHYDVYTLAKAFFPEEEIVVFNEMPMDGEAFDVVFEAEFPASAFAMSRKGVKNVLKEGLYRKFSAYTGKELPWGTLSGIRPVKIPFKMLSEGAGEAEILSYMQQTYLTGTKKAQLALAIAKREKEILDSMQDISEGCSLYVGIPFCPSICFYCTFSSGKVQDHEHQLQGYVDALLLELRGIAKLLEGRKLFTIYIGGGTPTALPPVLLEQLLSGIDALFDTGHVLEYTVEAGRPDTITQEILQIIRAHPVSRISINPQTMNDKTLEIIGRRHTAKETVEAFALARKLGFNNINMDIIAGLPGEGEQEILHTLSEIRQMQPESLTVHSLAVKRASRMNLEMERYRDYTYINNDEIMELAGEAAGEMGMAPYYLYRQKNMKGNLENIGYAVADHPGLYNILIMEERQSVFAAGAGAISKRVYDTVNFRAERAANVKNVEEYLQRIREMVSRKEELFVDFRKRDSV